MTGWERSGRLVLPIESATDVLHAAAVGTTFQLIALGADSSEHPLSRLIRDMVAAALLRPEPASTRAVSPVIAHLARDLRSALPSGPIGSLRATETALLHEWLAGLGAVTDLGKE